MIAEAELQLVRGTGNVFRDLGDPDAAVKQAKAILAADIISALDDAGFTVRKAGGATGFAAADWSRVRNANLDRFTIDRLIRMVGALRRAIGSTLPVPPVPKLQRCGAARDSMAPRPVIFDRSYIQGTHSLVELQRDWRLLFPDAFFFEVASTNASVRRSCLSRLREANRDGGVYVAPNAGELLRREIHGLRRAGPPSENLVQGLDLDRFFTRFDDLCEARREAVARTGADFGLDVDGLIERANMFHGRIQGTCEGTTGQRKEAYRRARRTVARDGDFISEFFTDFICRGDHAPPRRATPGGNRPDRKLRPGLDDVPLGAGATSLCA